MSSHKSNKADLMDYTAPSEVDIQKKKIIKTLVNYGKVIESYGKHLANISDFVNINKSSLDSNKLESILGAITDGAQIYVELSESMQTSYENIVNESKVVLGSLTAYQNSIIQKLQSLDNIAKVIGKINDGITTLKERRTEKDVPVKIDSQTISIAVAPVLLPLLDSQKNITTKIDSLSNIITKIANKQEKEISEQQTHIKELHNKVNDLTYKFATANRDKDLANETISQLKLQYAAAVSAIEDERNTRVNGLKDELEYLNMKLIRAQALLDDHKHADTKITHVVKVNEVNADQDTEVSADTDDSELLLDKSDNIEATTAIPNGIPNGIDKTDHIEVNNKINEDEKEENVIEEVDTNKDSKPKPVSKSRRGRSKKQ